MVEQDFSDVVLYFFESCYLPHGINAIAITLIPNRCGAERMVDFSLFSCCNVIYQWIYKILTDRLCVLLLNFISGNQYTFVLGRSIIDNILLCQELIEGYHINPGKPCSAMKVDL